jgi:hypothetical protein
VTVTGRVTEDVLAFGGIAASGRDVAGKGGVTFSFK